MRLGPIELRRSYATVPEGDVEAPSANAYGGDETSPYGAGMFGVKVNENPELQGRLRFAVYDEMRWGDPAVKSSLWLYKLPIRAATWTLDPATDDPVDRIVADAVAWQFGLDGKIGRMDLSWSEQLSQALLDLDYGCMFEEMVWGDVETWRDADGDEHTVRPLWRCAPRYPATVRVPDGIVTNAATGMIDLLIQDLPGAAPIPGDKLVWYTLDREGTDWFGVALLRSLFAPWTLKRALLVSAGMAWERYGLGVPAIWYPRGGGETRKREAESIGRNWRNHPRAYFTFEGRRGGDGSGWDVDIIQTAVNDPTGMLRYYDEQISTGAMQHFMVLGRTATGNRALGETLGDPFYMAAQAIAEDVALQKMRIAFRRFVDVNFGEDVAVPKLIVSDLQTHNIVELSQAVEALAAAGLSFADPDTQNDLRGALDLRELPEPAAAAIGALPPGVGVEGTGPPATAGGPEITGGTVPQPGPGIRTAPPGSVPVPTDARPNRLARFGEDRGLGL